MIIKESTESIDLTPCARCLHPIPFLHREEKNRGIVRGNELSRGVYTSRNKCVKQFNVIACVSYLTIVVLFDFAFTVIRIYATCTRRNEEKWERKRERRTHTVNAIK